MIATISPPAGLETVRPPTSAVAPDGHPIGFSKQRRAIRCQCCGRAEAPLKVLLLAGQHGDEEPARQSLQSLLATPAAALEERWPNLALAVIPDANPDGCAAGSRVNADGIDLNRDHQLLGSEETKAIHQFVRQWQPQVILDLHSYPSRRRHLLKKELVLDHDVFLDVPSHPAIRPRSVLMAPGDILQALLATLTARHIHADRYTIIEEDGSARHSTTDVVDARNGLALRYGAFTLLVENRQPRPEESFRERTRLQTMQERALWTLLQWLDENHSVFPPRQDLQLPDPGLPVQVRFKYERRWRGLQMACRHAGQARSVDVVFPQYCASLVAQRTVALPQAYAVPVELAALRELLSRHGYASFHGPPAAPSAVGRLRLDAVQPSREPGRSARALGLTQHAMKVSLERFEIFPTRQAGGEALAVYLEPESQHGLHRVPHLGIPLAAASWYPVLRVLEDHPRPR